MKWFSSIKKILTIHCNESAQLLSLRQEQPLSTTDKIALRLHLLLCKACRSYEKQLSFFRTCFDHFRKQINSRSMSSQSKEKIRKKIKDSREE